MPTPNPRRRKAVWAIKFSDGSLWINVDWKEEPKVQLETVKVFITELS